MESIYMKLLLRLWIFVLLTAILVCPCAHTAALTISSKYPPAPLFVTSLHRAPQTYNRNKPSGLPHPFILISKLRPCYTVESARQFGLLKNSSPASLAFITQMGGNIRLSSTLKPPPSEAGSYITTATTNHYRRWQSPTASTEPRVTTSKPAVVTQSHAKATNNANHGFSGHYTVTKPSPEINRVIVYNPDGTRVVPESVYKSHTKEPQLWEPLIVYMNATIRDVTSTPKDHLTSSSHQPTVYHSMENSQEEQAEIHQLSTSTSSTNVLFPTHGSSQPEAASSSTLATYVHPWTTNSHQGPHPAPLPPPLPPYHFSSSSPSSVVDNSNHFYSSINPGSSAYTGSLNLSWLGPPAKDTSNEIKTVTQISKPSTTVATAQQLPTKVVSVTRSGVSRLMTSPTVASSVEQQQSGESLFTRLGGGAKNIISQLFGGILSGGRRHGSEQLTENHGHPIDLNSWADKLRINTSGSSSISYLRPETLLPPPPATSASSQHPTRLGASLESVQAVHAGHLYTHGLQRPPVSMPPTTSKTPSLMDMFTDTLTTRMPSTSNETSLNVYHDLRQTMPFGLASYMVPILKVLSTSIPGKGPLEATTNSPPDWSLTSTKENRDGEYLSSVSFNDMEQNNTISGPSTFSAEEDLGNQGGDSDYKVKPLREFQNFAPPLGSMAFDDAERLTDDPSNYKIANDPLIEGRLKFNGVRTSQIDKGVNDHFNTESSKEEPSEIEPPETSTTPWRPLFELSPPRTRVTGPKLQFPAIQYDSINSSGYEHDFFENFRLPLKIRPTQLSPDMSIDHNSIASLTLANPTQIARLPSKIPLHFEVTTYRPKMAPLSPVDWLLGSKPIPFKVHPIEIGDAPERSSNPLARDGSHDVGHDHNNFHFRGSGIMSSSEDDFNATDTISEQDESDLLNGREADGESGLLESQEARENGNSNSMRGVETSTPGGAESEVRNGGTANATEVPRVIERQSEADLVPSTQNPSQIMEGNLESANGTINLFENRIDRWNQETSNVNLTKESVRSEITNQDIYNQVKEIYQHIRLGIPMPFDIVKPFFEKSNGLMRV